MRRAGRILLGVLILIAIAAPVLAPNDPTRTFPNSLYSPPTTLRGLVFYPQRLVSRLERRFEEDRDNPVRVRLFRNGKLLSVEDPKAPPLLLLGGDAFGRDIFSRLLYGARTSLSLAVVATLGALILGAAVGGVAGFSRGIVDDLLSRFSDFVLVLPAIYVALAFRSVLPLVLAASTVFTMLAVIFSLLGWPIVARGVRAIVASEREREYASAAEAIGAGRARLLIKHLLPATFGYLAVQATLLLPAFILAEATLSYVGLGFPDSVPTWGTMLQDTANVTLVADAPWTLAPAAAIFLFVLAVNLTIQGTGRAPVQLEA